MFQPAGSSFRVLRPSLWAAHRHGFAAAVMVMVGTVWLSLALTTLDVTPTLLASAFLGGSLLTALVRVLPKKP